MSGVKRVARLLEVAVVVALILFFAYGILKPSCVVTDRARVAETKANLHNIQLSIERYAVDRDGTYPEYLAGGGALCSAVVDENRTGGAFQETQACPELAKLADPLLAEGYIDEYPRNPFVRYGVTIHQAQLTMPLNAPGGDPLRNGVDTGRLYGTRFGAYCTSMGQLLGAKYYCPWAGPPIMPQSPAAATAFSMPGLPPGADVTYPCWDVWKSNKASNPLPGEFIYAGMGPVIALGSAAAHGQYTGLPAEIDSYILAAFGGPKTKGKDIMDSTGNPFLTKPMNPARPSDGVTTEYGNPNGIRDGVILVLTAGSDYIGDTARKQGPPMGGMWEPQGAPLQSRMPITNRRSQPDEAWLRPGMVGGTVAAGTVIMLADPADGGTVGPAANSLYNHPRTRGLYRWIQPEAWHKPAA